MEEELRLYAFNHYKLCGIHAGIQTQHSTQELNNDYPTCIEGGDNDFYNWAVNWKTTIILNGGNSQNLRNIKTFLESSIHEFYWSFFHESQEDMEGILTNVCIIVPEKIFGLSKRIGDLNKLQSNSDVYYDPDQVYRGMSEFEIDLATKMNTSQLMR